VAAELDAAREGTSALRSYAGHNAGELFAVATETFFCRPVEMAADSADLYGLLGDFYRQDPAARLRRLTAGG
jgi:Mlc titration factor MtfA (ptsG expression regulator)